MTDFWISCGHHLLDRDEGGGLLVSDDFLKVYLARPELVPPPEACAVERALHGALLADPRHAVSASDIAAIADADARENWGLMVAFRDHLLRHKTLEAAYADLMRGGDAGKFPLLFVNQLVHAILRNALDGVADARVVRAEAMRRWIAHVLGIEVTIEALKELRDVNLAWYVGLDADGTKIGDMLWHGEDIDEATMARTVGLFRLTFKDPALMLDRVKGEAVYMMLAMTPDKLIRMKPQNLLTGLPIRHLEAIG